MLLKPLTAALILLMAISVLSAQNAKPAELEKNRRVVYELFETQKLPAQMNRISQMMVKRMLDINPDLAPSAMEFSVFFEKTVGYEALKAELADIYLKHFTPEEIRQMTAFYRTPVGRKMAQVSGDVMEESNLLREKRIQEHIQSFMQDLADRKQAAPVLK